MTPLEWPEGLIPSEQSIGLSSNTMAFTSEFTNATQTVRIPGSFWTVDMTFSKKNDEEARLLEVLLVKLDGRSGRIKVHDFGYAYPTGLGSPVVDGALQSGLELRTRGWNPSTPILRAGDWITIGTELKKVTEDVVSDADGKAVIELGPLIRYSPADGAPVIYEEPYGIFMLTEDDNSWTRQPAMVNNFSLSLREAYP